MLLFCIHTHMHTLIRLFWTSPSDVTWKSLTDPFPVPTLFTVVAGVCFPGRCLVSLGDFAFIEWVESYLGENPMPCFPTQTLARNKFVSLILFPGTLIQEQWNKEREKKKQNRCSPPFKWHKQITLLNLWDHLCGSGCCKVCSSTCFRSIFAVQIAFFYSLLFSSLYWESKKFNLYFCYLNTVSYSFIFQFS